MADTETIDLRALACVQRNSGHVMLHLPQHRRDERICRFCHLTYSQVLNSTDPYVHIYNKYDISIRPVVMEGIHCNKTVADLPDWYVERYGRD